jgi:nitrogen fixation protein NifQ
MATPAVMIGDPVQYTHGRLMAYATGRNNDDAVACMLASNLNGHGALPPRMGLGSRAVEEMMAYHFPGASLPEASGWSDPQPADSGRADEWDELCRLLLAHRAGEDESEIWIAIIVANGCLASDHLWQDMGLWSRRDLSDLMERNFPRLAARNDRDMKWKKFLYKQLCVAEGIFTCRAPSCEICRDYDDCFGSED